MTSDLHVTCQVMVQAGMSSPGVISEEVCSSSGLIAGNIVSEGLQL